MALTASNPLIAALLGAPAYPHPVATPRLVETHISWVILTGTYAYKIKKPVNLGFLDFSTLAKRRHFCEEELRVNRCFAPQLYIDVVAICATDAGPRVAAVGEVLEYAVRMRQFPDDALLADRPERIALTVWRQLGEDVARVHAGLPARGDDEPGSCGTPVALRDAIAQNFRQIRPYLRDGAEILELNRLEEQAWSACRTHEKLLWQRHAEGRVRECHGDLHLGNIALIEGRAIPFDALEFNPALRWIDVLNEMAFLVMDCRSRGQQPASFAALNAYLELSGDYAGLALLDFFCSYRAMVRAKVSLLAVLPPVTSGSEAHRAYLRYSALAAEYQQPRHRFLAICCGVSGSGKSTLAEMLAAQAGAVRIRADVERKRLFGLEPDADSRGAGVDIYTAEAGRRTFARLAELAARIIGDGFAVIVDATFIRRSLRDDFRRLARELGVPFHILLCDAPTAELRRRVRARLASGADASEADVEVLEAQLRAAELPDPAREPETLRVGAIDPGSVAQLAARLDAS